MPSISGRRDRDHADADRWVKVIETTAKQPRSPSPFTILAAMQTIPSGTSAYLTVKLEAGPAQRRELRSRPAAPTFRIEASTSSIGCTAGIGLPARRSAVATWTRQPGFALAYTRAPVAST